MANAATTSSKADRAQQHVEEGAEQANPWIKRLARLGHVTKGVVYTIIGVLAAQAAFGSGGETTGSSGALQEIVSQPFGRVLLGIVAVGLIGYSLWRLVQALVDTEGKGKDAEGIGTRIGYVVSAVIYGTLAWTAVQIVMGSGGGGGSSTQDWTARLMAQPFGRWLVALVGLGIIGFGLYQLYQGISKKFLKKMTVAQMSNKEQKSATIAGQFGLSARGVVLGLIGIFFVQAAWQADPNEAKGLGSALQEIIQQPFGPWLLAAVAIGLIAYGVFMGFMGRYRKINLS